MEFANVNSDLQITLHHSYLWYHCIFFKNVAYWVLITIITSHTSSKSSWVQGYYSQLKLNLKQTKTKTNKKKSLTEIKKYFN